MIIIEKYFTKKILTLKLIKKNMKKLFLIVSIFSVGISFGQEKRVISYDTISKYSKNHLKIKGSIVYDEYISKDGSHYKVGDTIKINKPLSNNQFSFITDRFSQQSADAKLIGSLMVIKNIIVTGFKNTGYELYMTVNNSITTDQSIRFESAIDNNEIKSKIISSDEAISELKKAKEKLELDLITQADFDKLKVELVKYIK